MNILDLPDDVLEHILAIGGSPALVGKLAQTAHVFRLISTNESLWQSIHLQLWGDVSRSSESPHPVSWKKLCIRKWRRVHWPEETPLVEIREFVRGSMLRT
jgi:hypothetical protein